MLGFHALPRILYSIGSSSLRSCGMTPEKRTDSWVRPAEARAGEAVSTSGLGFLLRYAFFSSTTSTTATTYYNALWREYYFWLLVNVNIIIYGAALAWYLCLCSLCLVFFFLCVISSSSSAEMVSWLLMMAADDEKQKGRKGRKKKGMPSSHAFIAQPRTAWLGRDRSTTYILSWIWLGPVHSKLELLVAKQRC